MGNGVVDEGSPVDHRGRSRPLYTPRSAERPAAHSRWARLLYGAFPGLRTMALEDFTTGAPVAGLGLLTVAVGVFLVTSLDVTAEVLRGLDAEPALLLGQIGLIWLMVLSFEMLRLGASGVTKSRGPRAPRVLATGFWPGAAVCIGALGGAELWPALTQALFVGSLLLFLGSWPAVAYCILDVLFPPWGTRRRVERWTLGTVGGAAALIVGWLVLWPHPEWSARASWVGWDLVSTILR